MGNTSEKLCCTNKRDNSPIRQRTASANSIMSYKPSDINEMSKTNMGKKSRSFKQKRPHQVRETQKQSIKSSTHEFTTKNKTSWDNDEDTLETYHRNTTKQREADEVNSDDELVEKYKGKTRSFFEDIEKS